MKILTKEEEQAHYNATLQGGVVGGVTGLAVGATAVALATRRYHFFRQLTIPLRAFLVTSAGTFAGIISADHSSRAYERERNPIDREYDERQKEEAARASEGKTFTEKAMDFGRRERYKIVGGSWVASMFAAFALVNRNKFLTGQQKLVQARVYAQFLTVGVLVATAAFEISDRNNETGRYETVRVLDPNDPEHKKYINKQKYVEASDGDTLWKDMIAAEEERIKEREEDEKRIRSEQHKKKGGSSDKNNSKSGKDEKSSKDEKSNGDDKSGKDDDKSSKDEKSNKKDKSAGQAQGANKDDQHKVPTANDAKSKGIGNKDEKKEYVVGKKED